ncbi:MAG TPA: hypothetical protein VMF61_07485 [Candidatus Acidoferrales bacterium]|nr:hypothetical protein [Candidatus Acidoferrales bacterium]
MWQRDPRDRYYRERLAVSTVASLIVHVLLAALLFSVLVSSSQEGANEKVSGGEIVTLERRTPIQVAQQPATQAAPPVPHAPRVAPLQHAPLVQPQTQQLPQNRHELARQAPTAPPNPRPIPQRSPQPAPQPTQNVLETSPRPELPAVPVTTPTVAPVAVAVKAPPTAPPSPSPTSAPTARPSPRPPAPTAPPTEKPATPAPVVATAKPTAAPVAVHASAAPSASPAPAARVSAPPAQHRGVPSPSPTSTSAAVAKTQGTAPTPGPKGIGSPGPRPGNEPHAKPAPERPVQIRPAPSPRPATSPRATPAIDLNARLRALLPHNSVTPTSKQYVGTYSLRGDMDPTPPPAVLAKTKYIYDVRGTGNEERVKMWVIEAHKAGPTTMCTGWLVRYPAKLAGNYAPLPPNVNANVGPANGAQIAIGGGSPNSGPVSPFYSGEAPIVEGIVTSPCDGRRLVPYENSTAPSP